ncbi:Cytoplasmic dynein 2 heavy chain 1 [Hondaea fermentalgiana]|uniref:Cytoplasmic dynein 2 heavy chain 1 n=1 Tax=Hondaea fermentalgiana TaxID=2315210 RepID=A0A2R5G145_9STRA|nr:Cytoplasmic dynein 2 heavy chain 1 [Hondaea fermentalgiana]|eukprot:GBG24746.1 Cytoplasmic dynein 2 heavy chain 1 [Hondaea fermentalgiana]
METQVVLCAAGLLGESAREENLADEDALRTISRFLEDAEIRSLLVSVDETTGKLCATTRVEETLRESGKVRYAGFVKKNCGAVTNVGRDLIATSGCSLEDLYYCLHEVYGPAAGGPARQMVDRLDEDLREMVSHDGVIGLNEELTHFEHQRKGKAVAALIRQLVDAAETSTEDLVEVAATVLPELAESERAYPTQRLRALVHVLESRHIFGSGTLAAEGGVWGLSRHALQDKVRLGNQWIAVVRELALDANDALDATQHTLQRLEDVARIRATQAELHRLLAGENDFSEEKDANPESDEAVKESEQGASLFASEKAWNVTLVRFEARFARQEKSVAAKLRSRLANLGADRTVNLLVQYRSVMTRPNLRAMLVSERETAVASIARTLEEMEAEFDARSGSPPASKANASPTLAGVLWAKQLLRAVDGMSDHLRELFEDMAASERVLDNARSLAGRIEAWQADLFRDWCMDVEDDGADLGLSGQLLEIDVDGLVCVNFSERLVTLLREVRQFSELGFKVPSHIRDTAKRAEQVYHHGVMLQKTATLFNSMETQIIPSQKAMLLDALVEFETQITENKTAWDARSDPSACRAYVNQLRRAADKLTHENRQLQKSHQVLGHQAVQLMDIDLLRHGERWRQQWAKMTTLMNRMEASYPPKRMRAWKQHWDHQVYKALEASYRTGLETLNENLGEIKAEIVFSNATRAPQFRPAIEELRASYFRKMKKFIAIPASFAGFGATRGLFVKMADRNADALQQVYAKADTLFGRLDELCASFAPYVALGRVNDLDLLIDHLKLESASDFEVNFKAIKTRRKELDKVQDFHKIDCFAISTVALKMAVQDQLARLQDALLIALRRIVTTALRETDDYLSASMERLSTRPESIEEISEATAAWKRISDEKAGVKLRWDRVEPARKLLLTSCAGQIDIAEVLEIHARLPSSWDNFEVAVVAFDDMVQDQREALKARVDDDVEACRQRIDQFASRWNSLKPDASAVDWSQSAAVEAVLDELQEWKDQFDEIERIAAACRSNCEHFELPAPAFEALDLVKRDYETARGEWDKYRAFKDELTVLRDKDWISFRTNVYEAEDLARKWLADFKGQARGPVLDHIADVCEKLRKAVPALKFMRGEPFKEEHWSTLFRKLGMPKSVTLQSLRFGHFCDVLDAVAPALQFAKDMTARAQGEVTIRDAILELKAWAETAAVELMDHEEDGRVTPLIRNWRDVLTELGDNQSLLGSLKESPYYKPFEQQASVYEQNMADLDTYLGMMNQVQRKWLYLEPIFNKGALPSEATRFRRIDDDWVEIMQKLAADPMLFALCDETNFPRLRDTLTNMCDQLERCQKALADFLEEKRSKLPRFYFIGDDDLLEILGQARNPRVIQSHLKKLFQGIHSVRFDDGETAIVAVCSSAGEEVVLENPVAVTIHVETWLQELSDEVRRTLQALVVQCVHDKQVSLTAYPSQVLCVAESIKFTSRCEHAIKQGKLPSLKKLLRKTLQGYTSAQDLDALSQLKVKALVLDLVHHISICEEVEGADVQSTQDWHWDKQLRYYLTKDNACVVRMCDAELKYTYEYWGNAPKLVHTPLTDKCYLTLTQGMHMGFGGSPYGPAGTGKTESVKALGGCLGRQVLVFNCDEGLDHHSMGRIFTGLVKCGAWGCFDEFNRLKEDQLSAVSQQIQVIQAAIKDRASKVVLLGKKIDVDPNAGIFVTMNPAGKGYGGRSKLPDNLKQLFRPVAMSRPDNNLIAEVILYSEGFQDARNLGQKLVSLYTLSRQLLSAQLHYDWGLRAMKAVLNTGGKLVMDAKRKAGGAALPSEMECALLIQSIRVNTLSKLTFEDARAFEGLIRDIFPGAASSDVANEALEEAMRVVMTEEMRLVHNDVQVRKMLQLKESLDQRMGCVIVGPSGCGKTTLWKVLRASLQRTGAQIKVYEMNPKAMPRERLLGHMDMDTREWFDGVLTKAARQVVKEPAEVRSWIVCDGDVDPEWIESLNSVLDDNKLLTMPNGERISFGPNVNFIFETHDLRFASPATISRMGMIFLSDEDVDVRRLVQCWAPEIPEQFYQALDYVTTRCAGDQVVETTLVGLVRNGLSHVTKADPEDTAGFVTALVRGLGGNLEVSAREDFARYCYELFGESPPSSKRPLDCFADRGVLAPYAAHTHLEGEFSRLGAGGAILQTASVQRNLDMILPWMQCMEPFILVGPPGCGKGMLLTQCFRTLGKAAAVTTLHCNAQTTAAHVIQKIQQACSLYSTNTGRVYRPREAERLVLYLKDINLPKPDAYDTCMLIAFLQQLLTSRGFYDENLEFLGLERVQIVASMNPPTTVGRHVLSSRFTAAMRIAYVDYADADELVTVYTQILETALEDSGSTTNLRKLAETMVGVYREVKQRFSVDDHRHYQFTPRDLTAWVLGMLRYDDAELLDVFAYEARRIFSDRLVDESSRMAFESILGNIMRKIWQHRIDGDMLFSSLHDAEAGSMVRTSLEDFEEMVQHGLMMYEREESELNLRLFPEMLQNVAHVDRVLSEASGSLMLVGRSGVGRRTSVMLVAHMRKMRFLTPTCVPEAKAFQSDLKRAIESAGVEGTQTVLYVEDHHFFASEVLETINSLLCSGEVPGLYKHEELVPLLESLREAMQEDTSEEVRSPYEFFLRRVQRNLHVCVSMDPRHEAFLLRCESNPALYKRCTMLWFGTWSRETVSNFPRRLLPQYFGPDDAPEDWDVDGLERGAAAVHASMDGATPREYVYFLDTFRELYENKAGAITKKVSQFLGGLSKLEEASTTVDDLSADAATQRVELQRKQTAADASMDEITEALQLASKTRKETETLSEDLKRAEEETLARKGKIEEELSEIQPVLESAKQAVGQIKSEHLNELRSLNTPPEPVRDVLSAVLMLLGIRDTSWMSIKRFLGNRGVKEDILNFDTQRITADIRSQVMKLLRSKGSSFERSAIQRVSVAAAPMAAWVKANVRYSLVLDKIKPLEEELSEATHALEAAQQRMGACEDELAEIDERVKELQDNFKRTTREAAQLDAKLQDTEEVLAKAQHLLGMLSGEQERWVEQAETLKRMIGSLPLRILLSAAFVTYLGKATEQERAEKVRTWRELLAMDEDEFDFLQMMSSESEMLVWKSQQGLPGDLLSVENAILILHSQSRCPFIVDPASAATRWVRANLETCEVVTQQDARFVNQVELAVRFGKTLVVLEVDGVDPLLFPLIRRDLRRQGPRWVVQIGEKTVDYHEGFRLLLVTRTPRPMLPPNAAALVNEVNFTVTRSGLEGQLLGVTVEHEQPELEAQKSEVLREEEELKVQLSTLERELLDTLAASEGNLLENKTLLETLTKTKEKSASLGTSLEASAKVSQQLDEEREQYRAFARAGAEVFFSLGALAKVNHMYQFSLVWFVRMFRDVLKNGGAGSDSEATKVEDRMQALICALERCALGVCSRALFKGDRVMFAMHLVHTLRPQLFQRGEWEFFVGEAAQPGADADSESKNRHGDEDDNEDSGEGKVSSHADGSLPSWVAQERAGEWRALRESVPRVSIDLHADAWARWGRHAECERVFPREDGVALSAFQKVLVTQALRPDRLEAAMTHFCCEGLGLDALACAEASIAALADDPTRGKAPVLLIATAGADPTADLKTFAKQRVGLDHYHELAMGGGQTEDAILLLRDAARNGDWVCLKNLHLVTGWLPRLEKTFNGLENVHERFCLWLTTEETTGFAPVLLQQSVKATFEAPPGLKRNLQRTYADGHVGAGRLSFLLAWLHALMQERRTYIPQGWTKFYEFSLGDLRCGAGVIANQEAEDGEPTDWSYIHGLMENAVYGGRVDNPFDLNVLRAYLKEYFCDDKFEGTMLTDSLPMPAEGDEEAWIADLDDADAPSLFGLAPNVERSVLRARGAATVASLKALAAHATAAGGFDRQVWRRKLAPLIALWDRHHRSGDSRACQTVESKGPDDQGDGGESDPVMVFVRTETQRAQAIVDKVNASIRNLSAVLDGTGLLTPQIQAHAQALLQHEVPADWEALWAYGPTSARAWLRAVASRHAAIGKMGSLSQETQVDLSDLFHPGTYMKALQQRTARERGVSMDSLRMQSSFAAQQNAVVTLTGLLVQGALFDASSQRLQEPASDAPEVVPAPDCHVSFVECNDDDDDGEDQQRIPLYTSLEREHLLLELDIKAARHVVTAGVAVFIGE